MNVLCLILLLLLLQNLIVSIYSNTHDYINTNSLDHKKDNHDKPVNILLILADDLGYGDTSVKPFIGSGIKTPELEKMAMKGTIMTDFHTAAAICTPTRASILTGLYPWRLGIKGVFEYGLKSHNRDDWLPQIPTVALIFKDANYMTKHSGKWHLGGMRSDDYDLRTYNMNNTRCPHSGPNQQGFNEYVSLLDGPGAPRQNHLQIQSTLYSRGCNHLVHNDILLSDKHKISNNEFLSDCEVRHAIRMMNDSIIRKKPFYQQVWFHNPHGPWEELPGFQHLYPDRPAPIEALPNCSEDEVSQYCKIDNKNIKNRGKSFELKKYRTMVSSMDRSIGKLLNALRDFGIEKNTLVVFLSDNGPENGHGITGEYRMRKRYLYEGGIRVPAIFQWIGTIPGGRIIDNFGITTDLLPTFLDAARIKPPSNIYLDGISLLPELIGRRNPRKILNERIALWHNDYEGPRATVARYYDFKVFLNVKDELAEMYDLRSDKNESINLLAKLGAININILKEKYKSKTITSVKLLNDLETNRQSIELHTLIATKLYDVMHSFALHGNEAFLQFCSNHIGHIYPMSIGSDMRNVDPLFIQVKDKEKTMSRSILLDNWTCSINCSCAIPNISDVPPLPFDLVDKSRKFINPNVFFDGTALIVGHGHRGPI
jgi:arylsulfatase A-like enzyme